MSNHGNIVGGGEESLLTLLKGLDRSRWARTVVVPCNGCAAAEAQALNLRTACVPLPGLRLPGPAVIRTAAALSRLILATGARLLHAKGSRAMFYTGLLELLAILTRIRAGHPDAYLVIVGPLLVGTKDEYRDAIRRADVERAVAFRPKYVPHGRVATYFTAADVAVYNYRDVTDSGSLRIACTLGTPVVATSVGGFREFLTDGVTARLVPPGAPERLADAISDVLADPAGAAKMAEAARTLAASSWSWAESARATLELYRAICAGPRCGCPNAGRRAPGALTGQS